MSLLGPLLDAFSAVVARRTVLHAATDLGITQTAVTQRIRALESKLGSTLFLRSRKGMMLTSEGEALVRYCESARALEGELLAHIKSPGAEKTTWLKISGPSSTVRSRVISAVAKVLSEFPHVRLNIRVSDEGVWMEDVRRGTAHFAIVPRNQVPLEMDSRLLKRERYILVGPKSAKGVTPNKILSTLPIVDFDEADQMTLGFLEKHRLMTFALKDRHYINNTDALAELVAAGQGVTVLAEEFARPYIDRNQLVNLCPGRHFDHEIALVWYPRMEMPDYLRVVIKNLT